MRKFKEVSSAEVDKTAIHGTDGGLIGWDVPDYCHELLNHCVGNPERIWYYNKQSYSFDKFLETAELTEKERFWLIMKYG